MQTEQLNLKLQRGLYNEIDLVSKILHIPKNEWARNILAHEVKKELEDQKQSLIKEYLNGGITRTDLISVLGYKEAADIDRILKIGKKSFDDAKKLARMMK